jgi:putative CocE/NonD family hydrolase
VVLERTPFNRQNIQGDRFVRLGIFLVTQDTRGRGASEGKARLFLDDAWGRNSDGADTVAWIRRQPWCNGKIATTGLPPPQLLLAGAGPEGIVGQYAGVAPISLYHHAFYQNGVFRKGWEGWLRDAWPPEVLPLFRQHASYDDFWHGFDLRTRLGKVRWPMVHVAGWFDLFSQGSLDAFTELQARGGPGARGRQHLIAGPWEHFGLFKRQAGELTFPENAAGPPGAPDELQWLSFWLKGEPETVRNEHAVRYYVMGDVTDPQAPGNVWRAAERWPPSSHPLRLYFTPNGALTTKRATTAATCEYDYDPTDPVPTIGGQEAFVPAGPRDQCSVEGRADVLVFTTAPLDEPLEVTGRIRVRLYAATSTRDTDFTAKLCDVYPDGRSMLVTDGVVRARYRQTLARAAPITPGRAYAYDIDLWSTSLIFNRGHRIRVAISSSNSPRFEPNPSTWPPDVGAMPAVAHQTVYVGGSRASHIVLPVIRK